MCRGTVPGGRHGGAKGEAAVGLERDWPAARGLDALQDAQGAWLKVFHAQIVGGVPGRLALGAVISGRTGLLQNLGEAVAHLLQLVFREAEPIKDHVHAVEGTAEGGRDEVGIHFDRSATEEATPCDAGEEKLDAVVDLVEEVGPVWPGGLQRTQEGSNLA